MASVANTIRRIQKTRGNINPKYDASIQNILDIKGYSSGTESAICNGFVFGYAQGMKAAKSEMRRKKQ